MAVELNDIFNSAIENTLFSNKSVLQTNYTPESIPHRDKQIKLVASILAPILRGERASNLFLYGKTGCISGDSLIFTSNGWKMIKEVNYKIEKVLSFNKETKEYEWSDFIFLRFENHDKLLKIYLDNGNEIIVTKDHPLLDDKLKWVKADELKEGANISVAHNFNNLSSNKISTEMARLAGFAIGDGSLNKREKRVKDSKGTWYNSNRQRFRFFNEEPELLEMVKNDIKNIYGGTPQIIYPNNRCTHINIISQKVCGGLNNLGIAFGKKSSIVEVPEAILQSGESIQREFLKSLFSCDGFVSRHTYMVEYYSNSKKLLQQISLLLNQNGIYGKIRPKRAKCNGKLFDSFRLYIEGYENIVNFYYKIGFYSNKRQQLLAEMISKYKVKKVTNGKIKFSKIIKIEETFEPYVYDLTVPKNHNFIANGIISHNTGKTLSVQYVKNELLKKAHETGIDLRIEYLNCKLKKVADTEYRILAALIEQMGGSVPATGLPTDQVYSRFIEIIDRKKQLVILVFDEIDQAIKKISDSFLYNLTRLNSELSRAQISLIGISNDITFLENIDPRVRSSLGEEEIVFPPYNALQLQDILNERCKTAFKEGVVDEGVIAKCAAFAAREHGDARRALDLLRIAGELSERENNNKVDLKYIDMANSKIERDKILDIVETEPKQFQLVLYSILQLTKLNEHTQMFTGDVYNLYQEICKKTKTEILTQRRISDIIAEIDMIGLINAKVISKGRHGRTREIKLSIPKALFDKVESILVESLGI